MRASHRLRRIVRVAFAVDILRSAVGTAVVVGTVLNIINQGARWFDGDGLLLGHFLLNYAVPYAVATYSASRTRLQDIESGVDCRDILDTGNESS